MRVSGRDFFAAKIELVRLERLEVDSRCVVIGVESRVQLVDDLIVSADHHVQVGLDELVVVDGRAQVTLLVAAQTSHVDVRVVGARVLLFLDLISRPQSPRRSQHLYLFIKRLRDFRQIYQLTTTTKILTNL